MADVKTQPINGRALARTYHDNGDGTFSEVVTTNATSTSTQTVQGGAAAGAAPAGNPVETALLASTSPTAVAPGQVVPTAGNILGSTAMMAPVFAGDAGVDSVGSIGFDYRGNTSWIGEPIPVAIANYVFNGAANDRLRGNVNAGALVTLAAQAAGTVNSADQTNYNGRGAQVSVNVSAITTATLTINIQGKDSVSGVYYTLLSSTALATTGLTNLTVYPGVPVTANASTPQVLPRTWRVQAVVTGTSVTATVGASVIV